MSSLSIDCYRLCLETGDEAVVVTAADEVVRCSPELVESFRQDKTDDWRGMPTVAHDNDAEIVTMGTPGYGLGVVRYVITDERDRFDVTAFDQEKPTYIDGGRITLRRIHDDT